MTITVQKIPNMWTALGLASHFVARREPFGGFKSRELIRTLSAQMQRGHYLLALDRSEKEARVVGYVGWALYDRAVAERFAATGVPPQAELSEGGDVVWILTLAVQDRRTLSALFKAGRALYPAHRVMGIRHKADGRKVVLDRRNAKTLDGKGSSRRLPAS
jgi:hemolysin-activating ACP:hemolysin acyltransferase